MRVPDGGPRHLTYCANIHAGESFSEIFPNLQKALPVVKALVSPDAPFGVGPRLSARAADDLDNEKTLRDFQQFLGENDLYVFTINAFPYGQFHGGRIKENVYLPDWLDRRRLDYTRKTARLFAKLLPEGLSGSISTVPVAFKSRITSDEQAKVAAEMFVECAQYLHAIESETGKLITLNLEPEPFCYISTTRQCVEFFKEYLLFNRDDEKMIRRHLGICLDMAHMAVEFENPSESVAMLRAEGIDIGKVQLSAALQIEKPSDDALRDLKAFDDGHYLHQVSVKTKDEVSRYLDLDEALSAWNGDNAQIWRVHFHVPIFMTQMGVFSSTQDFLLDALGAIKAGDACMHFEVESYTWQVLPAQYRGEDVVHDIAREVLWAKEQL